MSDEKKAAYELVRTNFNAKRSKLSTATDRACGDNCGPCSCPGGSTCIPAVGTGTESIGYAGGVAGDMSA